MGEHEVEGWVWSVGTVEEDGVKSVALEIGDDGNPLVVDISPDIARRIGKALIGAADELGAE